jgi:hypothetical protein
MPAGEPKVPAQGPDRGLGALQTTGAIRLAISYGFPYDIGMTEVVTTGEARDALHRIAKHFDAGEGEPVYFGSHRRAQGVIVQVDVWEMLLEQVEDELDVELARDRLTNDKGRRLTPEEITAVSTGSVRPVEREPRQARTTLRPLVRAAGRSGPSRPRRDRPGGGGRG